MKELEAKELFRRCEPDQLGFDTTGELDSLTEILGQPRAVAAAEFGIGIDRQGYNLFCLGPPGTGKHSTIRRFLEEAAAQRSVPSDWCYVNNFEDPQKPKTLALPAGRGVELSRDMEHLVEEFQTALPAAFESEEYQARRQVLDEELKEHQSKAFDELQEQAKEEGLAVVRTPVGMIFAPRKNGDVLSREEFQELPEEEQKRLEKQVEELQGELEKIVRQVPRWQRERQEKLRGLNREVARFAVEPLVQELRKKYEEIGSVVEYLQAVEEDVVEQAQSFVSREQEGADALKILAAAFGGAGDSQAFLRRYRVNVLVDRSDSEGAPVVYEENPTYNNLIGRVEHQSQMGALVTDFNLIRSGALHRANGGYLLVDALKVLLQPFAWESLKRALRSGQLRIESAAQAWSLISTVSLEPEPVPLSLKVVLIGDRLLYYLLAAHDSEFGKLFKVAADFAEQMEWSDDNSQLYARFIAKLAKNEGLRPFHRSAVARVLEQSARIVGDAERLSLHGGKIVDLLREADYWARKAERQTVTAEDVQKAIDAQIYRSDRVRERLLEEIERGTILIDSEGHASGQVNGLVVLQLGGYAFGHPSRITARVRLGEGEVVNIEREVKLSGPIHSKGVLILSGFLGERYAGDRPLSLSASLVFEQSYAGVEGDSASLAELCGLLSAIAGLPIKQSLAVTGSVNQHGAVQAIGGVNEKIEGFFDVCKKRGLSGEQGVLIPSSNVKHLMLRQEVVDAVEAGQFHVWAVETVDEAIELLTGAVAGEREAEGHYPEGSVNRRVEDRLAELAEKRRTFAKLAAKVSQKEES